MWGDVRPSAALARQRPIFGRSWARCWCLTSLRSPRPLCRSWPPTLAPSAVFGSSASFLAGARSRRRSPRPRPPPPPLRRVRAAVPSPPSPAARQSDAISAPLPRRDPQPAFGRPQRPQVVREPGQRQEVGGVHGGSAVSRGFPCPTRGRAHLGPGPAVGRLPCPIHSAVCLLSLPPAPLLVFQLVLQLGDALLGLVERLVPRQLL